jgi:hypothetical protein
VLAAAIPAPVVGGGKQAEKWEYAELRHSSHAGASSIRWISADGYMSVEGWGVVIEKLKAPPVKKELLRGVEDLVARQIQRIHVLNHLGRQGWEMVAYKTEGTQSTWVFKRRVGK